MNDRTPPPVPSPVHAVHFFSDDEAMCRIVAKFLGEGLSTGQPALAIATAAHRAELMRELALQSFDVEQLMREGALLLVDAEATLSSFLSGPNILPAACRSRITELLAQADRARPGRRARVFGEMVDLLWRNSLHQTAVRLETLWNQLAQTHGFSLLCSYSIGYFNKDTSLDMVCREHSHVIDQHGELNRMSAVGATVEFA